MLREIAGIETRFITNVLESKRYTWTYILFEHVDEAQNEGTRLSTELFP